MEETDPGESLSADRESRTARRRRVGLRPTRGVRGCVREVSGLLSARWTRQSCEAIQMHDALLCGAQLERARRPAFSRTGGAGAATVAPVAAAQPFLEAGAGRLPLAAQALPSIDAWQFPVRSREARLAPLSRSRRYLSARFSSLRASRLSLDFWTSQLMMLINAISRRMMNCSMARLAPACPHQAPWLGFSVPAIDSRMSVSD